MLRLCKEQMPAFEDLALRGFEDQMVEHLKGFAPEHSRQIGQARVRDTIRLGIARSKMYGFTNVGPVQLFIELMFWFGSDFDTDPLFPWASTALNDPQYSEQMSRAMGLYNAIKDYFARVIGSNRKPYVRAMRRVHVAMQESMALDGADSERGLLDILTKVSPERWEYLGDEPLKALVLQGTSIAERLGLTLDRGAALAVVMAYSLGHGFASDPLYPWVEKTLKDSKITTPEMRVEWLERQGRVYLEDVVAYLERKHGNE